MATKESLHPTGTSTVTIRAKVKNGQVRLGITSKSSIAMNSWSRDQFLYLDGNLSKLGKISCVCYNNKQISQDMPCLPNGEFILKMEVNMTSKRLKYYLN